jgi:sulfur-carrier protein adenylyltransferase/sulfurtransferase
MTLLTTFSDNELKRYSQQIKLNNIGIDGQLKLRNAKVLCIGAGGLGSPVLTYLATAGVGTLGIVDDDRIELENLHRQILYLDRQIGMKKVVSAEQRIRELNPHLQVNPYQLRLNAENAPEIITNYDIIADCTDNFVSRYLLSDLCFRLDKPLVSASVSQYHGQCTMFVGRQGPCLRCLYPEQPHEGAVPDCEEGGVLGVLPGLLGIIQATEIIKWTLQQGDLLSGKVLTVDMMTLEFRLFNLPQNPDCDVCVHCRNIKPLQNQHQCIRASINMNDYHISPQELHDKLKNNEDIQLIDVRTAEKHQAYNIGGKLIPSEELTERLHELDPEKLAVTYCSSGGRSMRALQILLGAGFKRVKSLDGGMTAWQAHFHGGKLSLKGG